MKRLVNLMFLLFVSFGFRLSAEILKDDKIFTLNDQQISTNFIERPIAKSHRPDELNLEALDPLLQKSDFLGAMLSIGFERSFEAAARAKKITHLILIDSDPEVLILSRINKILLQLSENRKQYLYLRYDAAFDEVFNLLQNNVNLLNESKEFFNLDVFHIWTQVVRENGGLFGELENLNTNLSISDQLMLQSEKKSFSGFRYPFNDLEFNKIHKLAQTDSIETIEGDLGVYSNLYKLTEYLSRKNIQLSFINLSNVWKSTFLSTLQLLQLASAFNSIASPLRTTVILTQPKALSQPRILTVWMYLGLSFEFFINELRSVEFNSNDIFKFQFDYMQRSKLDTFSIEIPSRKSKRIATCHSVFL